MRRGQTSARAAALEAAAPPKPILEPSPALKTPIAALLICLAGVTAHAQAVDPARRGLTQPPPSCKSVTPHTCSTAQALGRGINLGNMLDAPEEGQWGVRLEPAYIDKVAASFATVRLPVRLTNHAALTGDAKLDEGFARRVDQAVDALLAKGVYVILDLHH